MTPLPPPLPLYRTDLFRPRYRPFESSRRHPNITEMVVYSGYRSPPLPRVERDDVRVWMSIPRSP